MIGWKTRDIAREYLGRLDELSVFEKIMEACLNGELKRFLVGLGLTNISYYLVWQDGYKFLDVQSRYGAYYFEWKFRVEDFQYLVFLEGQECDKPVVLSYDEFSDVERILDQMRETLPTKMYMGDR